MEIRKAKVLGFCVGVRRAVQIIEEEVQKGPLETLGAVVHNPHVVERLEAQGARVIRSLDEAHSSRVAITAHGVGEDTYRELQERELEVIDTTCPIVSRAQRAARKLAEEGFDVVIFGEADHPEVRGILGWTRGRGVATLDPEAPLKIHRRRVALLAQTTKGERAFVDFINRFLRKHIAELNEVRIVNTTCPETGKRYAAAEELAQWADLMLVVGGRNSANTRRLAETCSHAGAETYHIEDAAEIRREWLQGKERVGVTAGASTPDEAIEAVVRRVEELAQELEAVKQGQGR